MLPNVDGETHDNTEQNNEPMNDQSNKQKPPINKKTFKSPLKRKRPREDCETDIHKNIKDTVSNLTFCD